MNQLIKNLIFILKRFKLASIINLFGLTIAFTAFIFILIRVDYERSFDKFHPFSDRIFRVDVPGEDIFSVIMPRPLVEEIIHSSPHIVAGTILNPYLGNIYCFIGDETANERRGFKETFITCSPEIVHVFGFKILYGSKDCLNEPDKIIISRNMALRLFGQEDAVGKRIHVNQSIWMKTGSDFIVGAIYEDFPENSQLQNVIYTAMDRDADMDNWYQSNFICYVLLDDAKSKELVIDNYNRLVDRQKLRWNEEEGISLTLLSDIYYKNEFQDGKLFKSGNKRTTDLLIMIGILIILVAAVNYINFSTALAPVRIKSINIRKLLGHNNTILRFSLLLESVSIYILSVLLAVFLCVLISKFPYNSFLGNDSNLWNHPEIIFITIGLALFAGIGGGLYPAFYMTSFVPALVLKGNFGHSLAGRRLRTILIGLQYIISIGLIIVALVIHFQNQYMLSFSTGFDKDQIVIVELDRNVLNEHKSEYVNRLMGYSGIEDVAFSSQRFGAADSYPTSGLKYKEQNFQYFYVSVSWNFLQVMGIPLMGEKALHESIESSERTVYIFNENLKTQYGMESGEKINEWISVDGFTKKVKASSLRKGSDNIAFLINSNFNLPFSYIRIKAGSDYREVIKHIQKTITEIDPSYPVKIEFYDEIFNHLYKNELRISRMISVLSFLAIFISIIGIIGLVVFETQYRRKEVAIRKVYGSTTRQILNNFNHFYIRIVLVCFVFASPIAYFLANEWLQRFEYKISVSWLIFALALGFVLLITLIVVTFQNWQAANANPVNALKNE